MKKYLLLLGFIALMSGATLNAQVTIGKDKSPETFSVLELFSNGTRGMRLPQLTTTQRDVLMQTQSFIDEKTDKARGLTIFNTTTGCVETWNGNTWISACMDCGGVTFPALDSSYALCSNATISDLTAAIGDNVSWYDEFTNGNKYADNTALTSGETYYAELGVGNCKSAARTPVIATLGNYCSALTVSAYKIFSPVSVMYTYQYQDLTLYKGVSDGGDANSFKWYVKRKGDSSNGTAITDATSATYRVPSNYCSSNDTLVFTCEYTNPASTPQIATSTEIEFIHLNPANKFIDINGVDYYWAELDVPTSNTLPNYCNSTGKLKVLATNLGTETANAADFGDFYQWGRISDGHQTIGWSYTGTISCTVAFDAATNANQIAKTTGTITYDSNPDDAIEGGTPFMQITDNDHKNKFVFGADTWRASGSADRYIWATSAYAKTANDPCPFGWHVPTIYEWDALATGSSPATVYVSGTSYPTTYNSWRYPSAGFGGNTHVGGVVVTQGNDPDGTSRLFLPVVGYRGSSDGKLYDTGSVGFYCSSTYGNSNYTYFLHFTSGSISDGASFKAYGFSVRCVAE
jgi:uncharacterized protein (TIGR02145 family)